MRDPALLRWLKALVRAAWTVEYALRRGVGRGVARVFGPAGYRLAGGCEACARCCERPSIRSGALTWRLRSARALYLAWQRRVNGFELVEADPDTRTFVFRCGHFDWATRRCDSYASRPFLCRDYPRALLEQPWPDLFPECGFRPVARNADALRAALAATDLSDEERARLERRMFLT